MPRPAALQGRHARHRQEAAMTIDTSTDPALGGTDVGFGGAIATCLRKYVVFRGRARRPEYWYWMLFHTLLLIAATLLDLSLFQTSKISLFAALVALGLLLPDLAVTMRRLHDIDRSGWWILILLVPLIGPILLLIWNCTRGTDGPNRFGPEFARLAGAFPTVSEAG
jgi:uncharacterized membrane protein YhaH (DUF805 family)